MEKCKLLRDASMRTPRFGGYLKINKNLSTKAKTTAQLSRELIDSKNMYFMPQVNDDFNLDKHTRDVLNNVIGCIMHMASNKGNVSNSQLDLVEKYLKSIKENSAENLPNVDGILKHTSSLKTSPKPSNQIGDYTYAYKHNNDVYCALDDAKNIISMNNVGQNQRSRKFHEDRSSYISELEMVLRNSLKNM
ncbi:hypothetical protein RN001_012181 [Aquatica leii]|uniref:Uncharacterized protein n=1 Tax=Aquatica leii TaxID=1421715 RepID=A0AAN7SF16_9COLE|nr:hypothetical protein RN001_012181 [Aquatica leii]